ncbi:MAG: nitroreductase family protein [Dehalococcoidia bacterium]|nr:nitroreductase family protein [Dehalococcoidia bacterium]
MDVMQAIKGRRSIRKYRNEPVPEEALQTVLEAARWAPSWANTQCWRLIVVRDKETKLKLADILKGIRPGKSNPATEAVRNAPVVIAACAERGLSGLYKDESGQSLPATDKGDWWLMFDVALAVQNMSLAAYVLGLGTVHTGLLDAVEAARILDVPENVIVVELLPLGWPDEEPAARPRKEINEFVFFEKYQR